MSDSARESSDSDRDSLFDGDDSDSRSMHGEDGPLPGGKHLVGSIPAPRTNPQIPGLHFDPALLIPESLALQLLSQIREQNFFEGGTLNQVMLFGHPTSEGEKQGGAEPLVSGLPPLFDGLIAQLSTLLKPALPESTHTLLFPHDASSASYPARQAILNLYRPGEGITSHIDLLGRYGDGIIGVSLGSGIVMDFEREASGDRRSIWLPSRSVIVLEGEARYEWTHGIAERRVDLVDAEDGPPAPGMWIERGTRVSITLRWLLPGADVVGS